MINRSGGRPPLVAAIRCPIQIPADVGIWPAGAFHGNAARCLQWKEKQTLVGCGWHSCVCPDQSFATPRKGKVMANKITVETKIAAPIGQAWRAWNTPDDIKQWNAASDDWHTTKSAVDLRVGGAFSARMEAKDGSMGFDFAGTYTKVVEHRLIESTFGGRVLMVEFIAGQDGVTVRENEGFRSRGGSPADDAVAGMPR